MSEEEAVFVRRSRVRDGAAAFGLAQWSFLREGGEEKAHKKVSRTRRGGSHKLPCYRASMALYIHVCASVMIVVQSILELKGVCGRGKSGW